MKIQVEMEVNDKILCEARNNKSLFDHLSTQIVGEMKRKAFDALVDAIEKAHKDGLCSEEGKVIT